MLQDFAAQGISEGMLMMHGDEAEMNKAAHFVAQLNPVMAFKSIGGASELMARIFELEKEKKEEEEFEKEIREEERGQTPPLANKPSCLPAFSQRWRLLQTWRLRCRNCSRWSGSEMSLVRAHTHGLPSPRSLLTHGDICDQR